MLFRWKIWQFRTSEISRFWIFTSEIFKPANEIQEDESIQLPLHIPDKIDLLTKERKNGGVLKIDTSRPSSILSHPPGYIDKNKELIVGLQTDEPLKRAICPFSGLRNTIQACEAYNTEMDKEVLEKFKYRTTHNDGVFRIYTEEMKKARHAGLLTGLPDAYGRGRLIGDYRRIPLYGMAKLIYEKNQDRIRIGQQDMTEENMQLLEDLAKQIEFMKQLVEMANQYGYDSAYLKDGS